jgi:hypothetical protein
MTNPTGPLSRLERLIMGCKVGAAMLGIFAGLVAVVGTMMGSYYLLLHMGVSEPIAGPILFSFWGFLFIVLCIYVDTGEM